MRKIALATAVATTALGLTLAGAGAAMAVEEDPYTPVQPSSASLSGSSVGPVCHQEAPFIDYSVVLTDPDNTVTSRTAYLTLADGSHSYDIDLGELGEDGTLSGSVLWPGAHLAADGTPDSWPGWTQSNGQWVPTDGNYAWTRGAITATLHVNPSVNVPLSYPVQSSPCANPAGMELPFTEPAATQGMPNELAFTGGSMPWVALGVGVGAVALGAGALTVARRRAHR